MHSPGAAFRICVGIAEFLVIFVWGVNFARVNKCRYCRVLYRLIDRAAASTSVSEASNTM